MNRIINFNLKDKIITCEAGVTTKNIQDLAMKNGLFYPIDFAAVSASQIGGNIATNAGGINVIRYGLTRNWVYGLKVVTGNGELLELNYGLKKNAAGYDFRHLFIGSEGTLGFIAEASLKLTDLPLETKVILAAVTNKNLLNEIFPLFSESLPINAFEFFSEEALCHVIAEPPMRHPFSSPAPFYVLLEYESNEESDKIVQNILCNFLQKRIVSDALVSADKEHGAQLWKYRKSISLSLLKHSPYKYDIAVLPSLIPIFMKEIDGLFNKIYPNFEIIWFGHLGDGNLHLNILKPENLSTESFFTYCKDMSVEIYSIIQKYKGTVSAEHGVGLLKKEFLHYSRSLAEIEYMRQIKKVFDKNNIMNPGKIICQK